MRVSFRPTMDTLEQLRTSLADRYRIERELGAGILPLFDSGTADGQLYDVIAGRRPPARRRASMWAMGTSNA